MRSSLFVFGIDLVDRGTEAVLEELRAHDVGGVALATAYHHARDVFPHNPIRKVYYHEGGTVFFQPTPSSYGSIVPISAGIVNRHGDLLGELCAASERHSMEVTAWTVYLHNSRLAMTHPEHAPRNAFGDRLLTDLCPSHPAVREYARALTTDICRYPIRRVMAEALHFKTIEHGFHHERYFVNLGPTARFLLGLCFCDACSAAAEREGIEAGAVRGEVAAYLSAIFERGEGGHDPVDVDEIGQMAKGQMAGYLESRSESVTTLVREVAELASGAGVSLTYSAHGGSAKGGNTRSSDHPDDAWVLGVDLDRVTEFVDSYLILGYVEKPDELEELIGSYRARIGSVPFNVGLRPMWPDTRSGTDLAEKVRIARRAGAGGVDFYHYALMPRDSLGWIASAVSQ